MLNIRKDYALDYYPPPLLILVVDLEEGAAIFYGELRDDRNRPKHLAVMDDVMMVDLGQDAQVLKRPFSVS